MKITVGFLLLASFCLSGAVKDACSLVTAAEAEAALGEPVSAPQPEMRPSPPGEASACRYRSAQGRGLKGKSVSVSVHYSSTDLTGTMGAMADNMKTAGYQVQKMGGVGDEAIWATRAALGRPTGELTVRKGKSILLVVIINGLPGDAALDQAKALAAKALARA
jgi:hypothetical protein